MVRNRARKTNIGSIDENIMKDAVKNVVQYNKPLNTVAREFSIPRTTLRRYVQKCNNKEIDWDNDIPSTIPSMKPNYDVRRIFTNDEELKICNYIKISSKLHHGLTPTTSRKLIYEVAIANKKKIPDSWLRTSSAGKDFLTSFLKRHQNLSIRIPEATSLARSMAFNKPVIDKFFNDLEDLYVRYKFEPDRIYNMDETALTTVQGITKILAEKGQKQVGQLTSSERGTLISLCGTINALGNSIPPFLIYPRKKITDVMLKGTPHGTKGTGTQKGWMTSEAFMIYMQHFIKYSGATKTNKVLLIMDNHVAHISIDAIDLAKENGIVLFTLPPHTSHKIQPLDKTVYGPLKSYYNQTCKSWLACHPGKRITLNDIGELLGKNLLKDLYKYYYCLNF